jgi:hypothetical protein
MEAKYGVACSIFALAPQEKGLCEIQRERWGATIAQPWEKYWGYSSVDRASHTRYPTFVPYFGLFSTHNHSQDGRSFIKQETHQTPCFNWLDALS